MAATKPDVQHVHQESISTLNNVTVSEQGNLKTPDKAPLSMNKVHLASETKLPLSSSHRHN